MRSEFNGRGAAPYTPVRRLVAIAVACVVAAGVVAGLSGSARAADSPITLPVFEVPDTVHVDADEMTLREIIERSVEGEKTKLAGHENMMFTMGIRSIVQWKKKRHVTDAAMLTYQEESGFRRAVRLAEQTREYKLRDGVWQYEKDNEEEEMEVRVEFSDQGEGLAQLPFFLEEQEEYSFSLLGRYLEDDHVIFKIGFKPRSNFKPLPSGTVYVDTDEFRVIHEEFSFDGQNPFPLLLKGINRISRQWRQLVTGEWVVSKVMAEIDFRGSWMGFMPERASVAVVLEDYRFNQAYDANLFGER